VEAGKCETPDRYTLVDSADADNNRKCVTADKCGSMIGDNVTGSETNGQCIDIAICQAEAKKQCGDGEKWVEGNECVPDCNNHGTWDETDEECECTAPYVPTADGKSCELDCGEEAEYDSEKDQCDCNEEGHVFVADGKTCVPDCDKHGEWKDDACVCELGFELSSDKLHCDAHACNEEGTIWNDETKECQPDCDGHGTWTVDKCVCETDYDLSADNEHCEEKPGCEAGKIWNDETGECQPDCDMHGKWDVAKEECHCKLGYKMTDDKLHCEEQACDGAGMIWTDDGTDS